MIHHHLRRRQISQQSSVMKLSCLFYFYCNAFNTTQCCIVLFLLFSSSVSFRFFLLFLHFLVSFCLRSDQSGCHIRLQLTHATSHHNCQYSITPHHSILHHTHISPLSCSIHHHRSTPSWHHVWHGENPLQPIKHTWVHLMLHITNKKHESKIKTWVITWLRKMMSMWLISKHYSFHWPCSALRLLLLLLLLLLLWTRHICFHWTWRLAMWWCGCGCGCDWLWCDSWWRHRTGYFHKSLCFSLQTNK